MRLVLAVLSVGACSGTSTPPAGEDPPPSNTSDNTPPDTGTSDTDTTPLPTDTGETGSGFGTNYSNPGPFGVTMDTGTREGGGNNCSEPYRLFRPDVPSDTLVVLSHGFSRDQIAVEDLAEHLASYGLTVVTTNLCHSTPFDNDPEQDAADLIALADTSGVQRRLYVGHSAGAMRSLLAAVQDPSTIAVLGLDLVDVFDLALDAAPLLDAPLFGLLGEPYSCNSDGNGLPVYDAAPGSVPLQIVEADHCDFESPTDWMCTTFCDQPGDTFTDDQIQDVIFGLTTAFAVWQSGIDPDGSSWWTDGGVAHDTLIASGAVIGR